jgi:hypothetical protein
MEIMTNFQYLSKLLEAGASIGIDAKGVYCRAGEGGQLPNELREEWEKRKVPLCDILLKAKRAGLTYIWSKTLNDLIVIAKTSDIAAPSEVVLYTEDEIRKMNGMSEDGLRQAHQAKTLFGGTIIKGPGMVRKGGGMP